MDKTLTIDAIWESSNHGTMREDIARAYDAGVNAERERCMTVCDDSLSFDCDDPGGFFAQLIKESGK